jgi:hypothetical protein
MDRAARWEAGEVPPAAIPPLASLRPELLRLALAFVVYLALYPLWRASGMFDLYSAAVRTSAEAMSRALGVLGHGERIAPEALPNLESAIVFIVALALVASRLPIAARLWRYGLLVLTVVTLNIACLLIDVAVAVAKPSFPRQGGSIQMPAGYVALEIPHFALHVGALKAWPFVAALLTFAWNAKLRREGVSTTSGTPPPEVLGPLSPPRTG